MSEIIIKSGENFEKALRRFNKESSSIKREVRKREYYLTKKEKRKLKSKNRKNR